MKFIHSFLERGNPDVVKLFIVIAVFCVFCLCLGLAIKHDENVHEREKRDSRIALEALIRSSGSSSTTDYLRQVSDSWYRVCHAVSCPPRQELTVIPAGDETFVFWLKSRFGARSEDLGFTGWSVSVESLSALVWICGNQIKHVSQLRVTLADTDYRGNSANYEVQLTPGVPFGKKWESPADSDLRTLVKRRMDVLANTASGKEWKLAVQ